MNRLSRVLILSVLLAGVLMSSGCASPSFGPSIDADVEPINRNGAPTALVACPSSPNCVSSVATNAQKLVAPFDLSGAELSAFQAQLVSAIEADGGAVKDIREGYVWATYTSSVFRFVDDIEWLFNAEKNAFDVRSASRVGRSDFGVNAKRVERLRNLL